MVFIWVFIFQVLFNIFKVLEIRYTLHYQVNKLLMNSVWINLVALASTYIAGSVVGKYIGMKIDVNGRGESVSSDLY
jgi:hypothetical protein